MLSREGEKWAIAGGGREVKGRVFLKWVEGSVMHADGNDYREWRIDSVGEKRRRFLIRSEREVASCGNMESSSRTAALRVWLVDPRGSQRPF